MLLQTTEARYQFFINSFFSGVEGLQYLGLGGFRVWGLCFLFSVCGAGVQGFRLFV